jgi:hypothetical protein
VGDELVKVLAPDEPVKGVHEVEALLIRHRAESIIRVDALVADAQLGILVILTILLNCLLCENTSISRATVAN